MEIIPIGHKIEQFKAHLEDNKRVVLSARFGDGKSFFLEQVKRELENEYFFITLFPVNYSVAKNDDVFEYIKRDILLQLAEADLLTDIDFDTIADSIFSWENLREVISFLLTFVQGGELLKKILKKIDPIKKRYDENKSTWKKYESFFTIQRGGIYENDGYTKLIGATIEWIKNPINGLGKKTVLVIEDLDRIDPMHLFRILNVLGAHIDVDKEKNKFGFDNIVLVLDYTTTSYIFHHFYGMEADYSGYMSKFISCYPFEYSIKDIAKNYVFDYIEKECGLSREIASNIKVELRYSKGRMTLEQCLSSMSVRDIANAIDGLCKQYRCDEIIEFEYFEISTNVGLIKFLALLKRLCINCSPSDIYDIEDDSVLKMLGGFILLEGRINLVTSFEFHGSLYHLRCFKSYEYSVMRGSANGYETIPVTVELFKKVFNVAGKYVKDF